MVPSTAQDKFESISGTLDPLRGLQRTLKANLANSRQIVTFPDPPHPPPDFLVKFFASEMACRGVTHIVKHILDSTHTFLGHSRPSKVSWRHIAIGEIITLFGEDYHFWGVRFYWG